MKKNLLFLLFLFQFGILTAQTLQSPEQFLGYKVGTRFTPHNKILNYFNAVAAAKPDMVKIEKYGETNEGRDLIVAYIALPDNLQRIDAIRTNNLRFAGMMKDGIAAVTADAPAIVWLSYNVHGNEPASSEAAMLTLFALTDTNNTQTKEWLKNTIVIIDPCLNPDGRDRYVNWYNTAVGMRFNADPQSREHDEPWPRGRTNHYYFDLNRDWAWQTQKESRARIKKYDEWLPQVHVDFHEQGYDDPYYFAPAAEPYHEVITQWQRDFQVQIGKNNAKYFDNNGWLYFTKEIFDLFYPSYGDTYPMYNGAIGMTYEQGGIGAGLGIKTNANDTLTLVDRAMHHFTASMSTIEMTAENANKLISEYKKFFSDNMNAVGMDYKTYVLTAKDANQVQAIADLLDANKIEYGIPAAKNFKGYNYFTGKEENYTDDGYQLAVSVYQPKGRLVKVLFEPKSLLSDSSTYDITAWSVPYAYGVKAYGVKEKLELSSYNVKSPPSNIQAGYGLLIPYTSLNAAKVLTSLLRQNVKVRFTQSPFIYNHKNYERGTLIVLKANNVANWNEITNRACNMFNVQADIVESGFMERGPDLGSEAIKFIHTPKVALLTGREVSSEAAGEVWNYFDEELNYPISQLNADELEDLKLDNYDVLIIPNGDYSTISDKVVSGKLQNYVKNGGKIIAFENGVVSLAALDWSGLKLKEDKDADTAKSGTDYSLLKKFGESERTNLATFIPGAIYKTELDNTYLLAYGYPDFYYTLKQDRRLYEFLKIGWNVGVIKTTSYISGFVGSKLKSNLKDGLLIGEKDYGKGNIVIFADDPLFRLFWQNGKLMFANAVFLVGQ